MSKIFWLWKDTCSKPRQNCFGSWIEHCLHYTYLSHQWDYSRRHWEILDEEMHTPKVNLSKGDISPEWLYHSRKSWWWATEFLLIEKLISFSLIRRKQKLTRTVTLICWRLPYCLNIVDIIWTVTLNSCKTVFHHTVQKWCNSFYDRTLQTS